VVTATAAVMAAAEVEGDAEDVDEVNALLPSQAAPFDDSADNGGVSSNILSTAPNVSDSSCVIGAFSLINLFTKFSTMAI